MILPRPQRTAADAQITPDTQNSGQTPTEVIICAQGALGALPFHLAGPADNANHVLVQDMTVTSVAALSLLHASSWRTPDRVSVLSGPDIDDTPSIEAADLAVTPVDRWQDLPAATQVVHIGAHAAAQPADPLSSAIHTAAGPIALQDLLSGDTATPDLVVLAACETAIPAPDAPDDGLSFPAALLASGATRVIASQWAVPHSATTDLMARFYRRLGAGDRPAVALQGAQLEFRDAARDGVINPAWQHPYWWGGFVHSGPI